MLESWLIVSALKDSDRRSFQASGVDIRIGQMEKAFQYLLLLLA